MFDDRVIFTGPVFSLPQSAEIDDVEILRILSSVKPKLLCTLGTSGNKEALFEVIKMLNLKDCPWSAVVLCPPAICDITEARRICHNPDVYLTDAFVPAPEINARVDAVVCHGGQGTLQTAILSGTPLVGMPTQPEQQMNLLHLEDYGMAINIPPRKWEAKRIWASVNKLFSDRKYREAAMRLRERAEELDSRKIISDTILACIRNAVERRKEK
ncbi:glycosyltransferase [Porphyromonas sp.]|uniref:glycosyltransferase n=1 Tax=Porphyromonas sp. TaxID=1924944 RepID=UPI0026DB04ED|nr:nucleotide disphospho-sugar-binding domain-containing protein [Porphyromonas sp.]MDO4770608.1 glycosyltransferase [Porphyromonas sp.]